MTKLKTLLILSISLAASAAAQAATDLTLPVKHVLTNEAAHVIIDAAKRDAVQRGVVGSIAVVDDGGHLIALDHMDKATVASSDIAAAKARTAAMFGRPTVLLEKAINDGRQAAITGGFNMMSGGVPIVFRGEIIGAVGVSTPTPPNDDPIAAVASHALDALQPK